MALVWRRLISRVRCLGFAFRLLWTRILGRASFKVVGVWFWIFCSSLRSASASGRPISARVGMMSCLIVFA